MVYNPVLAEPTVQSKLEERGKTCHKNDKDKPKYLQLMFFGTFWGLLAHFCSTLNLGMCNDLFNDLPNVLFFTHTNKMDGFEIHPCVAEVSR